MKNKLKKYFPWIMIVLVTIFYFEYSVSILWDSAHYMNYVNIFEGNLAWNQWDVVRGPVFPIIIYLGNFIFGKTSQGLLMNTYLYYVIMLVFCYRILREFFLEDKKITIKKRNVIIGLFIFLMVIINPIIFGFYHSLLTEFVAITLSMVSCYYAYKILEIDFFEERKKYLKILGLFIFLTIFAWFLKQPYVSCGLFAFVISLFISIFEKRNLKNIIVRVCSLLICVLCLGIAIVGWNKFLSSLGNNPDTGRNPTNSLGSQMINAIDFLEIKTDKDIYKADYIRGSKLSRKEQAEVLISDDNNYVIVNIFEDDKLVDADYIITKDEYGNISTLDAAFYIMRVFVNKPFELLESYLTNYLSIIDIYSTRTIDGVGYESNKEIDLSFSNEISAIAFKPYFYAGSNIFYMTDEMYERVSCYEQTNYVFRGLNFIMRKLGIVFLAIFKLVFLLLPILLISSLVMRFVSKKNEFYNKNLNLVIILLGFSLLHVMLHTVTGAIIDRYAIPAFITTILGTFMFFRIVLKNVKLKKIIFRNRRK